MQYILTRKNNKEYVLGFEDAELIKPKWLAYVNDKINTLITVSDDTFSVNEIKSLEKTSRTTDQKLKSGNDVVAQSNEDYRNARKEFAQMPVAKKIATKKSYIDLMWQTYTGEKVPEEIKNEVKTRMIEFYKNNPKRMFPDHTVFKDLLERADKKPKPIGFDVIKSIIATDVYYANR